MKRLWVPSVILGVSASLLGSAYAAATPTIDPIDALPATENSRFGNDPAVRIEPDSAGYQIKSAATGDQTGVTLPGQGTVHSANSGFRTKALSGRSAAQLSSDGLKVHIDFAGSGVASEEFVVDFDSSIVRTMPIRNGYLVVNFSDGASVLLEEPVAKDINGADVPVRYTIAANSLTINTVSDTRGVVISSAFSYNFNYGIGKTTPAKAKSKLKNCFNCSFPISGAPKGFPVKGQKLPLKVAGMNFSCTFRTEVSGSDGDGSSWWGYTFDSAKGHVDGAGSWIAFTFEKRGNGSNYLGVVANVANLNLPNPWGATEAAYKAGAKSQWKKFATKMNS